MSLSKPKVLITTGGTGGHIFPAQTLALELTQTGYDVLFVGGNLDKNRYFNRDLFPFKTVSSATPFRGNVFKSLYQIIKGIYQSLKILKEFRPHLIIGFGGFYSFPILAAACLKRLAIVLFEPNAAAGRVNKIFSPWALYSAVQFPAAVQDLKGKIIEVKMLVGQKLRTNAEEARLHFYLNPKSFTFLVFGGSQGSQFINRLFAQAIGSISTSASFQVIHITGDVESADRIRKEYAQLGICSCVKAFEPRMDLVWSAADVVISRSGASTIAELIIFEVPGILVPFPRALDDHQTKNAHFIEKQIGGAISFPESALTTDKLKTAIENLLNSNQIQKMQEAIGYFKKNDQKIELSHLIEEILKEKKTDE